MSVDEIARMFEADAEKEAKQVPADDKLKLIADLCDKHLALEDEIELIEKELKEAKAKLFDLSADKIPTAMSDAGCESFTLTGGQVVSVETGYQAHIKKTNVVPAHAWLRDHGHGGLIKNEVKIELGVGEEEKVKVIEDFLDAQGQSFKRKEAVHASTLKSFVREQMEQEECSLPQDLFGVFEYKVTKIKDPPKKKKTSCNV